MRSVYPGVDLIYYGRQGQLEYDFVLAPGADASLIRMQFDGAKPSLARNGDLVLPVDGGPQVRFNKPVVYQTKNGVRQMVEGSFAIDAVNQVSFHLGAYDHSSELVIDPTLDFLGTLGTGSVGTVPNGMTVDSLGEIILTGYTFDLDFPATPGAYQTSCGAVTQPSNTNLIRCGPTHTVNFSSAFVAKISADGSSLVYATYLHGASGGESGTSVAADSDGNAYVLGLTSSNDFPITSDAYQTMCNPYYPVIGVGPNFYPIAPSCDGYFAGGGTEWTVGGPSLFISKLNATGSTLLYSTFFGGTAAAYPVGIALDGSNNIYFTSQSSQAEPNTNYYPYSTTIPFPTAVPNAPGPAGSTYQPSGPVNAAYQPFGVGVQAATLSKLSADGQTLLYSTLMGTQSTSTFFAYSIPTSLAVGPNGIAYIGGLTRASNFPVTPGAVKGACTLSSGNAGNCVNLTGFLSAFDTTKSGASSLVYSTFIGGTETGNSIQQVQALAADGSNNVYVTGTTQSTDYPTTAGAYQTACTLQGTICNATFLSKINPTGTAYVWSTLYGADQPNLSDIGEAIGLDGQGLVYLYGQSQSGGGDWVNPLHTPKYGSDKIFIAAFSADGSQLEFATQVGNLSATTNENDEPISSNGLYVDSTGNMYFVGYTADSGQLTPTAGAYANAAVNGGDRVFFGKISPLTTPLTPQTITFNPLPNKTFGAAPFNVSATASSNLPVSFAPTTLSTCTVSGNLVTIVQGGPCTIQATQAGNSSFSAATPVNQTFQILAATPVITWATPANMLYGGALGQTQLNATANTPGTFVYTPAFGAVLPVGNQQTLSVSFTPSNSVDYNSASSSVLINVLPPQGTPVNMVLTSTLSRVPNTQQILLSVEVTNAGGTAAVNLTLTSITLASVASSLSMPSLIGTLDPVSGVPIYAYFPASLGTSGTRAVLSITGTYNGGSFTSNARVVLP
jgi:hypothetical protein